MTEIRFSLSASDGEHCLEDARRLHACIRKWTSLAIWP